MYTSETELHHMQHMKRANLKRKRNARVRTKPASRSAAPPLRGFANFQRTLSPRVLRALHLCPKLLQPYQRAKFRVSEDEKHVTLIIREIEATTTPWRYVRDARNAQRY